MSWRPIFLVGFAILLVVFFSPVHTAFAATVTVPIDVTVAEAGAPPFTWTISGSCAPSPSSGSTGGAVTVTMTGSCAYTIVVPADGPTQRDRLTSGVAYVASLGEQSCASGACSTVADTAHVQELLAVSTSCNGALVSVASPTGDGWFNYGTSLIVTCNGVWARSLGTGTRAASWNWDGGTNTIVATTSTFTSSSQTMDAGHTLNVNTVTQFQLTLDRRAGGALATVTSPTITSDKYWYDTGTIVAYKGYGVFDRASGVGNRSTSWTLDSGSPTALTTTGNFTITVTMTSAHTVHVTLVTQYLVTLNPAASGMLSSITSPTVANDKNWYDAGTPFSLVLNGVAQRSAGTGVRLNSYSLNARPPVTVATAGAVMVFSAYPINQTESVAGTIVTQYQLTLDSGASRALSAVTSPPIQGDNYWYDAGTQVTYSGNGVFGRSAGTGSRVTGWWWDSAAATPVTTAGTFPASITMNAPHELHTTAVTQFQVALTGTYGVSSATPPTISGDNYWYDTGTVVSLSLDGVFGRASGTGERLVSYSVNGGPSINNETAGAVGVLNALKVTSPQTIAVTAVTQYELTMDAVTLQALASATAPTLKGDNYWYDSGSAVLVVADGIWERNSTTGYRLVSFSVNGAQPLIVTSKGSVTLLDISAISTPESIVSTKTTQYLLAVNGGGGPTYSTNPPITGDTGWYDSGTTLKVSTNGTYNSADGVRLRIASWSTDGEAGITVGVVGVVTTSAITIDAPHTVSFVSATQYLVTIVVKDSAGTDTLTPESIQLNVGGGSQTLTGDELWVDGGSALSVTGITWHGANVAPVVPAQYTVTSPLTATVYARVYDATIVVKDPFGLPVGGASAAITLANGTTIQATTAGNGSILLRMIPLGTYHGTVSYLGLSSSVSGDASIQSSVGVGVSLSYPVLITLVAVIVLIVVAIIIIRRR
ncbi:MAG: hypothetical protein ACLQEQ_08810 [Nitrososphaerales archaeon]